jgi:hypothetical protein
VAQTDAELSQLRSVFDLYQVHVGLLVEKAGLEGAFLLEVLYSPVNIVPLTF